MSTPPATNCFTLAKSPSNEAVWMFPPLHPAIRNDAQAKLNAKKFSCLPLILINLDDKKLLFCRF